MPQRCRPFHPSARRHLTPNTAQPGSGGQCHGEGRHGAAFGGSGKPISPKTDVRRVLAPYSEPMKKLLEDAESFYRPKVRPAI